MLPYDEELMAIPIYFCPGCLTPLDISKGFEKMSRKAIREQRSNGSACTEQYGLSESQVDNGVEVRVGKRCAKVRLVGVPWKD